MSLISTPKNCDVGVKKAIQAITTRLGKDSTPTFTGLTLAGLTDNSLTYSLSGTITSLGAATDGQIPIGDTGAVPVLATITGTANQVNIANAAGSITLSLPQNIHTGASPTFAALTTTSGRIQTTERFTGADTLDAGNHICFCDTDGGAFTITLPAGVEGTNYKIINCGTSSNDLTVDGDGAETVLGEVTPILSDGEVINIHYNATEGWW